jgi:hypothetical protein
MSKISLSLKSTALGVVGLLVALPAFAQDYGLGETAGKIGYNQNQNAYDIIGLVVSGALATLAIVFFGLTLYAGMRWLTARGNDEYVQKAKNTLTATIIGLVLVLGAYAITGFILARLKTAPNQNQELLDAGGTTTVSQPQSCFNGVKDGLETDKDCGGVCDAKCANLRVCVENKDCQSNNCVGGACEAGGTSCTNNIKDGLESDVDCGGVCPNRCGISKYCNSASDCVSGQSCTLSPVKQLNTCGGA